MTKSGRETKREALPKGIIDDTSKLVYNNVNNLVTPAKISSSNDVVLIVVVVIVVVSIMLLSQSVKIIA